MGTRQPENTRSIAIAAHGGAGKTSLVEAMLFDNGITSRLGRVEDGNTVSDFMGAVRLKAGIISKTLDGVKVLGNGELTKALTVKAAAYSASAKEKIEKAGGKAEVM